MLVDNSSELDEKVLKQLALRCHSDFEFFAKTCLKVVGKNGELAPFILNKEQKALHNKLELQLVTKKKVRAIILKARQIGISTYIEGRFYWQLWRTKVGKTLRAFILTHQGEATDNLFNMAKRYHENMPPHLKPPLSRSNIKELIFADTGCCYSVATAGGVEIGRGSTLHYCHLSEMAFWPNPEMHVTSLLNTALSGADGTESIIESTANGIGDVFHRYWQAAAKEQSEYEAIFFPWFFHDEYRSEVPETWNCPEELLEYGQIYELDWEQLYWAYLKNRESAFAAGLPDDKFTPKFRQEYPACIEANQRVGTNRGYIPISEVRFGDKVSTGMVSKIYKNGLKETVKIKTEMGYSVICTKDHLIQLQNSNWEKSENLLNKFIKLQKPIFAEKLTSVNWSKFPCVKSEVVIDSNFGRFLGFFMGDGCWHDNTLSIACDAQDEDVIDSLKQTLSMIIGEPSERLTGTKKGCKELRISRKDFQEILEALDVIDMSTKPHRRVKVPDCIWRSPRHVIKEFLRGLFEADGFAGYAACRVSLFSKHKEFLEDVQKLLLGFGMTCIVKSQNKINTAGYTYIGNVLEMRSAEARAFLKEVGFVSKRKQGKLEAFKPLGIGGRKASPMLLVDKIVSIENIGLREVIDLTIPDTHCFDASGIMVHNCADEAFVTSGESFIPAMAILRARKPPEPIRGTGPIVIGIDPARTGDLVGIIDRCGRRMGERIAERWEPGGNLVHLSERIAKVLDKIRPDAVCIDVGGNGAGVYDNLLDWGYGGIIHAVNFGSKPVGRGPTGDEMYFNRRAEMYDNLRAWFNTEGGVQIPDDDALQTDLTSIKVGPGATRYNNNNELIIEDKDKIKQRLGASPDLGDAAALTMAVTFYHRAEANWQPPPPRRKTNRRTGY